MTRLPQWPWVCARFVANESNHFLEFRTRPVFSCALESHVSIVQWNHPNATPTAAAGRWSGPVYVIEPDWGREKIVSDLLPFFLGNYGAVRWPGGDYDSRLGATESDEPGSYYLCKLSWMMVVCAKRLISWWLQLMPCHGCKLDENHMVMWVTFGYVIYWDLI
jgi:hypothetical protein